MRFSSWRCGKPWKRALTLALLLLAARVRRSRSDRSVVYRRLDETLVWWGSTRRCSSRTLVAKGVIHQRGTDAGQRRL